MSKFPNGRADVNAFYGNPAKPDGSLNPQWQTENIIVVNLPYPMVTSWDGQKVTKVQIHRKCADALLASFSDILQAVKDTLRIEAKKEIPLEEMRERMAVKYGKAVGSKENDNLVSGSYDLMVSPRVGPRLHTLGLDVLGGTFNFRAIRGASSLSLHSYGAAIDLDPSNNALGDVKGAMPAFSVAIFKKHGATWGGDFKGRKDPMHFQWASGV
jgi:hypothetical protein